MNFRIPRHEDESDYYGSSSQDETRGNQGTNFIWTLSVCDIYLFADD